MACEVAIGGNGNPFVDRKPLRLLRGFSDLNNPNWKTPDQTLIFKGMLLITIDYVISTVAIRFPVDRAIASLRLVSWQSAKMETPVWIGNPWRNSELRQGFPAIGGVSYPRGGG